MTHPTDTSEELRDCGCKGLQMCHLCAASEGAKDAREAMSRARSTTGLMEVDVRGIALVAMDEQRKSGESDEMCARWISERVHKAAAQSPTPREKP